MATLYRQYRPQRFGEVAGQEQVVKTLQRALTQNAVAQAYLFHGPRGTGKTTMARLFAKRLNCLQPQEAEPCTTCAACVAMQSGASLDVIEIDAASNRGIDDIRALKEALNLAPSLGKYRVYIIDEVHMLTREAFTALLKTLEEPAQHVLFILATTEFHKVPDTVLSRCQVYRFRRATDTELRQRLEYILTQEKREVAPDAVQFVISRSDGCFRDAESLLGQGLSLHAGKIELSDISSLLGLPSQALIERLVSALVQGDAGQAVAAVDEAFAEGFDPEQVVAESIRACRDGALAIITGQSTVWQFASDARALPRLPIVLRALIQAAQDLDVVPQPLIALHLAILNLSTTQQPITAPAPAATEPQPVPAPTLSSPTPVQPEEAPAPVATIPDEQLPVKKLWPALIQAIKHDNPVASTFLRAMEPISTEENMVRVQASYGLHRSFFDKEENRVLLEQHLSKLLGTETKVRIVLQEVVSAAPQPLKPRDQQRQEQELLTTVQEVFGQPAQ